MAISIAIDKTCGSSYVKVPFEIEANLVAKIHNIPVGVVTSLINQELRPDSTSLASRIEFPTMTAVAAA